MGLTFLNWYCYTCVPPHDVRAVTVEWLFAIVCRSLTIIDSVELCRRLATRRCFSNTCTSDGGVCG